MELVWSNEFLVLWDLWDGYATCLSSFSFYLVNLVWINHIGKNNCNWINVFCSETSEKKSNSFNFWSILIQANRYGEARAIFLPRSRGLFLTGIRGEREPFRDPGFSSSSIKRIQDPRRFLPRIANPFWPPPIHSNETLSILFDFLNPELCPIQFHRKLYNLSNDSSISYILVIDTRGENDQHG